VALGRGDACGESLVMMPKRLPAQRPKHENFNFFNHISKTLKTSDKR
jgi:hypothetical protein